MRIPFFRIFYSTTFTVLSLILAIALIITPANLIYEAFRVRQFYDIFIVAGFSILKFIVVVLLYASRLYNNRRNLLHIPKDWSPLKEGDVEAKVRKLVAEKLEESAIIAHKSKPRDLSKDPSQILRDPEAAADPQIPQPNRPDHRDPIYEIPPWGTISHPGWSSPSSSDLPNIHFEPIILELPNLIEAKAVSLAPLDPLDDPVPATTDPSGIPLPDALIVELLQRSPTMGLRDYFAHLTALGVLDQPDLTGAFLALYEKARFSGYPIGEREFRHLMAMFADILRGLKELDPEIVAQVRADHESLMLPDDEEDRDGPVVYEPRTSFDSNETVQHTPQPDMYYTPRPERFSLSSGSEAGSEGSVRTAPSHPGSKRTVSKTSRSPSARLLQQRAMTPSTRSLRKMKSHASSLASQTSKGSVIRLAEARTPLDLPYTIVTSSQEAL
ncbi:MAG: hypothetical protein Q9179_006601 [Wetmoreana sp. 5 TL-2023]